MLPAIFYSFSRLKVDEESQEISYKKRLFWFFPSEKVSMSLSDGDWSVYREKRLIINGVKERVPSKMLKEFRSVMKQYDNVEAPVFSSDRFFKRLFGSKILQFGHKRLYIAGNEFTTRKFHYSQLTFNKAKLTHSNHHLLLNEYALAYEEKKVNEIFALLKKTIAYEGQLFFDKIFAFRRKYLLLGTEHCFAENLGTRIKDIVYFDRFDHFKVKVDFGNAAHFSYRNFGSAPADYIFDYFVERGAPIKIAGTVIKSRRVILNPTSLFFQSIITLGEDGVHFSRPVGWRKYKTSYIPYRNFYYLKLRNFFFFWKKIEAYGSQNILPSQCFWFRDAQKFREIILENNPEIANRTGCRYRTFRWIPFAPKETVLITGSRVMYYHPKSRVPICIKGSQIDTSKKINDKGFWGWLLWRHVIVTFNLDNLRYDESSIKIEELVEKTLKKYEIEEKQVNKALKDEYNYSHMFVIPHMWRRSATRLINGLSTAHSIFDDEEVYDYTVIYDHDDTDDPFHIFTPAGVLIDGVAKDSSSDSEANADEDTIEHYVPTDDDVATEKVPFNIGDFVSQNKFLVISLAVLFVLLIGSELFPRILFTILSNRPHTEKVEEQSTYAHDTVLPDTDFSEDNYFTTEEEQTDEEPAEEDTTIDTDMMETASRIVFAMVLPQGAMADDMEERAISYCTPSFIDALKRENDFDDGSIAWWALRTMEQDGSDDSYILAIIPDGDNAVLVDYLDMGHSGSTRLEFVKVGDSCKINSATVNYNSKTRTIK